MREAYLRLPHARHAPAAAYYVWRSMKGEPPDHARRPTMDIGSATQSTQISTVMRQAASAESKPSEREPDGDSDDTLLKVQ